jgi:hypothetical protein
LLYLFFGCTKPFGETFPRRFKLLTTEY